MARAMVRKRRVPNGRLLSSLSSCSELSSLALSESCSGLIRESRRRQARIARVK